MARGSWSVDRDAADPGPVASDQVRSYKDLRVWRTSIDWVEAIYRTTSRWPSDERFGLISQVRRAAVSIPSNIAEGAARRTTGEFLQFLGVAHGSLAEAETQLIIASRIGLLPDPELAALLDQSDIIGRMISGMKTSLKERR